MRITEVRATPVAVPLRVPEVWAFGRRTGQLSVLVEVETDEGLTGIGEASAYPSVDVVTAALRSVRPLVLGEDPTEIERLVKRVEVVGTWHHMKNTSPALSGLEMACWDILGKLCGQPLFRLFGGRFHDSVEFFYYVTGSTPDDLRAMAAEGARAGFTTFYLKVGSPDPEDDLARVAAVREGAGPQALIRIDANEAWSPAAAIRILRRMAPYDLEFAEQPVSGRNLTEMAYVRSRADVPLLANEASWTRFDQLEVIRHGAADAVSVDNQMDGGLLNLKRAAGLCEAAGLGVVKHSLGELGVAMAAGLHVMAATPNFIYANQGYASILADDILAEPLRYERGALRPPEAPGLGVRLDAEKVARYAEDYARDPDAFGFTDRATGAAHLPRL